MVQHIGPGDWAVPCTNDAQGVSGIRRGAHWAMEGLEELGSWERMVVRKEMKRSRIRVGKAIGV